MTITKAYVRRYADNGQTKAYIEWTDGPGKQGRTEGDPRNAHMMALLARAERESCTVVREVW